MIAVLTPTSNDGLWRAHFSKMSSSVARTKGSVRVAGLSDAGIVRVIAACTSAAELVARGYAADVALAIQIESSIGAPRLIAGGYRTMETDR